MPSYGTELRRVLLRAEQAKGGTQSRPLYRGTLNFGA
jgi:hypothetical protein